MSTPEAGSTLDRSQSILLPEFGSVAVQSFLVMNQELQLPIIVEDMPLDDALGQLKAGEVAAVLAGANHTTGEVISQGIQKFNPRRNTAGEEDPKGQRKFVSSFFVFERGNDHPFMMSDCAVEPMPQEHELLQIAEQTVHNARLIGLDPHVAFLSYSTEGSGHGASARKIQAVVERFKELYPDVPAIGEAQWDAANDERIYTKKTGKQWPGTEPPNVFIAPNLDTGNGIYKVLQDAHKGGGWTAAGPLLQGFEGGVQLHDLSRGVTPEALAVICRYIAKLCQLEIPSETNPRPEPDQPEA